MNIREFSHNLLKLYQEMSDSFATYQSGTGWNCLAGCGRCCLNPEVEATMFEMIPMALAIYDEGTLEEWMEKLQTTTQSHCLVYQQGNSEMEGRCGRYKDRPSLCRMFGVAGYKNKQAEVTLSICKYIKDEYKLENIPTNLDPATTPMMIEWSYKLANLDPRLIQNKMPINQALLFALEKVALYAQYQEN